MSTSTPSPTDLSLQSRLHAATRTQHTSINRLITSRLPLCLPPHTTSPEEYYTGILLFSHLYTIFEHITHEALSTGCREQRHQQILQTLQTPRLARKTALKADLDTLAQRLNLPSHPGSITQQAQAYTQPIHSRLRHSPYLTLAWSWAMYLALFNGGTYIHRALVSAGPAFWREKSDSQDITCLSFWRFDSTVPGAEDVKLAFKQNFDAAADLLTETERAEVVEEGKRVFELCETMVHWLDGHMLQKQELASAETKEEEQSHDVQSKFFAAGKHTADHESWFTPARNLWQTVSLRSGFDSWLRPVRQQVDVTE